MVPYSRVLIIMVLSLTAPTLLVARPLKRTVGISTAAMLELKEMGENVQRLLSPQTYGLTLNVFSDVEETPEPNPGQAKIAMEAVLKPLIAECGGDSHDLNSLIKFPGFVSSGMLVGLGKGGSLHGAFIVGQAQLERWRSRYRHLRKAIEDERIRLIRPPGEPKPPVVIVVPNADKKGNEKALSEEQGECLARIFSTVNLVRVNVAFNQEVKKLLVRSGRLPRKRKVESEDSKSRPHFVGRWRRRSQDESKTHPTE